MAVRVIVLLLIVCLFVRSDALSKECKSERSFTQAYDAQTLNDVLNPSTRENFLGAGSFGEVKQAFLDKIVQNDVAVKMITIGTRKSEIDGIKEEINYLKKLGGKDVTPYFYDCLESDGKVYIIQQMLYQSLLTPEMISKFQSFRPSKRIFKFLQIAIKLKDFHADGDTHQDLKPDNIMSIDDDMSDFRIVDLGMATDVLGKVKGGTPLFNSPDKINGDSRPSCYQDVFAFAMTMVVMEMSSYEFFDDVPDKCFRKFSEECKDQYVAKLKQLGSKTKENNLSLLFMYLSKVILSKETLILIDLIEEMTEIYYFLVNKFENGKGRYKNRSYSIYKKSRPPGKKFYEQKYFEDIGANIIL